MGLAEAARRGIVDAQGMRRSLIALAAGVISNLAFAPVFAWPVLFLTLPVFVWLIDGAGSGKAGLGRAFASGWWFGFGFFFVGLFWIGEAFLVEADKFGWALPFAVTLMPAGLSLFFGAAAWASRAGWVPGFPRIVLLAIAFSCAEFLRGTVLTGFPWNTLGYALTAPLVLMQSAGLLGIYALSAWVVIICASPLVLALDCKPGERSQGFVRGAFAALAPLLLLTAYGLFALSGEPPGDRPDIKIRVVQPSIPQREKWIPENQGRIFKDHIALSEHSAAGEADGLQGITHVIWPEAAMPFLPLEHPEALAAIGEALPPDRVLISGGLRRETAADGQVRAFNSLMVFDDKGTVTAIYDKTHLVPFGEYLPFQPILEAIGLRQLTRMRGGFTEGHEPRPLLEIGGLSSVGALICYEVIFPGVGRLTEARPDVLLNITNDGWFGNTTGPRQHFHAARVRAVEEGVPLIRAANNGISAVIDSKGRVVHKLGLNVRGIFDSAVPKSSSPPPFGLYGDWIFTANTVFLALAYLFLSQRGQQAR